MIYDAPIKPSELFVLKDIVISLALYIFPCAVKSQEFAKNHEFELNQFDCMSKSYPQNSELNCFTS